MLEIKDLKVKVGEFNIDVKKLKLEDGDYLIIVGPTGAGKTVLLETIAGFHTPIKGKIILNGKDITASPPNRREISIVYQDYMLFPHMTVRENIEYPLKLRKINGNVEELARKLGIEKLLDRYPPTLSGGELQRAAIARAVILKPKLLLLDEPFSALDPKMRDSARALVRDFIAELGIDTIHVTHDFSDAWVMGNKLAVMRDGQIVRYGPVDEVFADPRNDFVASFLGSTNILNGRVVENDDLTKIKINGIAVFTVDSAQIGRRVLLSVRPENIVLSKEEPRGSQRNVLLLEIKGMRKEGHIVWIDLGNENLNLKAILTPNAVESMGLTVGMRVYTSFKASATRIVRVL